MTRTSTELIPRPRYNKPSTEGLTNPRSRALQTLDRGFVKTSTEVFKYLGRGLKKIDLAHIQTNEIFPVPCRGVNLAIPSTSLSGVDTDKFTNESSIH